MSTPVLTSDIPVMDVETTRLAAAPAPLGRRPPLPHHPASPAFAGGNRRRGPSVQREDPALRRTALGFARPGHDSLRAGLIGGRGCGGGAGGGGWGGGGQLRLLDRGGARAVRGGGGGPQVPPRLQRRV
jgi:hypothetical protein